MFTPKKILAIKLRALGDTVIMTAPLLKLREAYPKAEIHVVVTDQWKDILNGHPAVDHLWTYTKHREIAARAKALARLAFRLRKIKFDLAVNFHASPSSATLAFASGAKTRAIHFHGHKDKNRHSTLKIPGKGQVKPAIERDMDALRSFLAEVPEGALPKIFLSDQEKSEAKSKFKSLKRPILALSMGASRPTKCWPIESFAEVANDWITRKQGSIVAFSTPNESHKVEALSQLLSDPSRITHIVSPPLRELSACLAEADLYLGNDSGPKHIAVAVGTPTITLFGPEHPLEWHPYPRDQHPYFFIETLTCRKDALPGKPPWCGLTVCTVEKHRCMKEITSDKVIQAMESLIK